MYVHVAYVCIFNVTRLHCIIMSFIDLVPKSGAGTDSSGEESPAASPALLPKPRGTSKTLYDMNMHVEFASRLMLNRTWCEFCWEEELRSGCKSAGALVLVA